MTSPAAAAHAAPAARAQAAAAERARGVATPVDSPSPQIYAGFATRAVALAVDAAIVNGVALLVGVVAGLCLSLLHTSDQVDTVLLAIGGMLFVGWVMAYFIVFWSTTGQTPGSRLMRIRVAQAAAGGPLRARWACVRLGGMVLAALPLLLGYLPILLNDRRRGLPDFLARSVVIYEVDGAGSTHAGV